MISGMPLPYMLHGSSENPMSGVVIPDRELIVPVLSIWLHGVQAGWSLGILSPNMNILKKSIGKI